MDTGERVRRAGSIITWIAVGLGLLCELVGETEAGLFLGIVWIIGIIIWFVGTSIMIKEKKKNRTGNQTGRGRKETGTGKRESGVEKRPPAAGIWGIEYFFYQCFFERRRTEGEKKADDTDSGDSCGSRTPVDIDTFYI